MALPLSRLSSMKIPNVRKFIQNLNSKTDSICICTFIIVCRFGCLSHFNGKMILKLPYTCLRVGITTSHKSSVFSALSTIDSFKSMVSKLEKENCLNISCGIYPSTSSVSSLLRVNVVISPWFYQNVGEAEYIVSVYIYMRSLGYPASKISILTTYNGQKLLIRDVISRRCKAYGIEPHSKVATVDNFQGQQNDFILLSLVRTRFVGHLRDVRRLIVAMSRARLGLYVFCRRALFEQCFELQTTFRLLLQRPDKLGLNLQETTPFTDRPVRVTGMVRFVEGVEDMEQLASFRMHELYQMQMMNQYRPVEELPENQNGTDEAGPIKNEVQNVEMPLASSGESKPEPEPEPDSGNIAQEDDASADNSKMEELIL